MVRHGQTAWHSESRHVGNVDIPLDETGRSQADRLVGRFADSEIDVIFSSPLSRCLEMAELVAASNGLPVKADDRLREIDFGEWSGEKYSDVAEKYGNIVEHWTRDVNSLTPPGGESLAQVRERTLSWFQQAWMEHTWKNLYVFSHSTPIRILVSELMGLPMEHMFWLSLSLASITSLTYNGEAACLEVLNETCHLRP
jgi:broad specificity phosphatase PhoE